MNIQKLIVAATASGIVFAAGFSATATSHKPANDQMQSMMGKGMMAPGLMLPSMNSSRGRLLFASKGCVVCHSINGIGGEDAPPLDALTMPMPMNPFDFAAKMWGGAEAMVALQREELGDPIELSGEELGDIIAFVHDAQEQIKFSETDIPERIEKLMGHIDEEGDDHDD